MLSKVGYPVGSACARRTLQLCDPRHKVDNCMLGMDWLQGLVIQLELNLQRGLHVMWGLTLSSIAGRA